MLDLLPQLLFLLFCTPLAMLWGGCCCEGCLCYKLTNCADPEDFFYSDTDLSSYLGKVVRIDGDTDTCWLVTCESSECDTVQSVAVTASYNTCNECACLCYKLTDCHEETVIYTDTDLEAYLGEYVALDEYPGTRWFVECEIDSEACEDTESVTVIESYEFCDDPSPCLAAECPPGTPLPSTVTVTIAGVVDNIGACPAGQCTALNNTFVLNLHCVADEGESVCATYTHSFGSARCAPTTFNGIVATITPGIVANTLRVQVSVYNTANTNPPDASCGTSVLGTHEFFFGAIGCTSGSSGSLGPSSAGTNFGPCGVAGVGGVTVNVTIN